MIGISQRDRAALTRETVRFVREDAIRPAVRRVWRRHRLLLRRMLPGADIQHVGSTAIAGSLTKGDLDIQVRVTQRRFPAADLALSHVYARNLKSTRTRAFSAFESTDDGMSVGVQLTVKGSPQDLFWKLREVLKLRPDLRTAFDDLKLQFQGALMDDYREAKNAFFRRVRRTPEFRKTGPAPQPPIIHFQKLVDVHRRRGMLPGPG